MTVEQDIPGTADKLVVVAREVKEVQSAIYYYNEQNWLAARYVR